jgi:co-chaperonin GroES (HSP10)
MPNNTIEITQAEFDRMRMLNNNVAIEITHRNAEEKTKSGLVIVQDPKMFSVHSVQAAEQYNVSQHMDRWGIVAKVPDRLIFAKDNKHYGMDWETDMELKVGDLVWSDYYTLNCSVDTTIIKVEEKQYWIVTYDLLIVAKRKHDTGTWLNYWYNDSKDGTVDSWEEVIPLNDYCLFEQVNEGLKSKFLELPKVINKKFGIVKYNGKLTKRYNAKGRFDNVELRRGDEVVFRLEFECLLEDPQHRKFEDCDLRYEHRYNIQAIKRHEEK